MPRRMTVEQKATRMAEVVRMRRARVSWDKIGAALEIDGSTAYRIYREALTNHPLVGAQIDEHRIEEQELIDTAVQSLMGIAVNSRTDKDGRPLVSPRTRVEAWSAIRAWAERKAKLLGLDAPTRHEVVTIDYLDQQIALLEAELGEDTPPEVELPSPRTRARASKG